MNWGERDKVMSSTAFNAINAPHIYFSRYLNYSENVKYSYFEDLPNELRSMPCYPQKGYYRYIDGTVYVKVSNDYVDTSEKN